MIKLFKFFKLSFLTMISFASLCEAQNLRRVDVFKGPGHAIGSELISLGNKVLFLANDSIHGQELWCSDGTIKGTYMLSDTLGPNYNPWSPFRSIVKMGNYIYFFYEVDRNRQVLWRSDGTKNGLEIISDTFDFYTNLRLFTVMNNKIVFMTPYQNGESEIWVSDGKPGGMKVYKDIDAHNLWTELNGEFLYIKGGYTNNLWISDKNNPVGIQLTNFPRMESGSAYSYLGTHNGLAIIAVNDSIHGTELWKTDGTPVGTVLLKDINPGKLGTTFFDAFNYQNKLYIIASDSLSRTVIWQTDGTESGTFKDSLLSMKLSEFPSYGGFKVAGGLIYFMGYVPMKGILPCRTDGTAAGTFAFEEVKLYSDFYYNPYFIEHNSKVYFIAYDNNSSTQLWQTDGSHAGTRMLNNYRGLEKTSAGAYLRAVGQSFVYVLNELNYGSELMIWNPKANDIKSIQTGNLIVYPNPADNELSIEGKDYTIKTVKVYDISGRLMMEEPSDALTKHTLDINALEPGIYTLEVLTAEGESVISKFIRQ